MHQVNMLNALKIKNFFDIALVTLVFSMNALTSLQFSSCFLLTCICQIVFEVKLIKRHLQGKLSVTCLSNNFITFPNHSSERKFNYFFLKKESIKEKLPDLLQQFCEQSYFIVNSLTDFSQHYFFQDLNVFKLFTWYSNSSEGIFTTTQARLYPSH